jgi:hypothetical protein
MIRVEIKQRMTTVALITMINTISVVIVSVKLNISL